MSNIYIQEPPTSGKVMLHTTVGDIDIELWSKEAPKACRNFVQLCLESYYNGTIFHRVVKGFIAQGGDPQGDGTGGESVYGKPFKDEFHSRLRFVRRGLLAMANGGKDDNGSQFFFTLGSCPDLQNKHTVFGKVTGDTLYNMLKLEDCIVDSNDRPLYPHKIISSKVLLSPFPDIVPRVFEKPVDTVDKKVKPKEKVKKNFKLLSFGEEAEEEELEVDSIAQIFRGKSKSSHDLANDPKLSSVSAMSLYVEEDVKLKKGQQVENVKKKLKKSEMLNSEKATESQSVAKVSKSSTSERDEIRKQIKELTKELRKKSAPQAETKDESVLDSGNKIAGENDNNNTLLEEFHEQQNIHSEKRKLIPRNREEREKMTLDLLAKLQSRLKQAKESVKDSDEKPDANDESNDDDDGWLVHKLHSEDRQVVAKDANLPSEDRYDITDPRNPINQRRRQEKKRKHRHHHDKS